MTGGGTIGFYIDEIQLMLSNSTPPTSNPPQALVNTSDATSHTVSLTGSSTSVKIAEGTGITLTTTGTGNNAIVTIASTVGGSNYVPLAAFFADASNVGSGETDLYSFVVPGNTLVTNGDKLVCRFGGIYNSPTAAQLRFYFAGSNSALTSTAANQDWTLEVTLIRVSSSVARLIIKQICSFDDVTDAQIQEYTSLDFTTTQTLKITGQDASSGQITAKLGFIDKVIF